MERSDVPQPGHPARRDSYRAVERRCDASAGAKRREWDRAAPGGTFSDDKSIAWSGALSVEGGYGWQCVRFSLRVAGRGGIRAADCVRECGEFVAGEIA